MMKGRGMRNQNGGRAKLFISSLVSVFLIPYFSSLVSVSSAEDTLQESLSELNRILPAKRVVRITWGRDPFVPLVGDGFLGPVSVRLTAIIYNEKNPSATSAILNDKIVYVGDSLDGQKVIDITKQYVILRGKSGSYKLEINSVGKRSYDIKKEPGDGGQK